MRPDIPLPGSLSRTPDLPPDTAFPGVFSVSAKLRPWSRSCAPRPSGPPRPPSFGPSLTHICLPVPSVVRLLSCSLAARPETWRFPVSLLDHRARPRQPRSASHRADLAASTLSPCVCSQPGDHRQSPKSRSGPGTPLLRPRRWFLLKVES